MRRFAAITLHQRDAALDVRERAALEVERADAGGDAVGVLTCHRVECYASVPADADPRGWAAARLGPELAAEGAVATGADAFRHLFEVACGLDSEIVGERQILGQLRRAYDGARARSVDPLIAAAFERALHLGRVLRATTPLGAVTASVGSLAVDAVVRRVADPARATVLVVGAGEMGKLAARALARRVGAVVIANRDHARAARLAEEIGAHTVPLSGVAGALVRADAVISAADTRGRVLTRDLLAGATRGRTLVVADVAVPRSVDADARALPGLAYLSVDDLGAASAVPPAVVRDVRERCAAEAEALVREVRGRAAAATIGALRERGEAMRRAHLARALGRLGHLSERDRRVVDALSSSLVGALLHEPTVALREAPERQAAARELFGL
ncbi:MAG TPA: glutamyl-tRNA reductase [Candidatus Limnocylindria bacterium]|nr:glutamyl-tRNA reductase [Candidatus Limnocylindria bacterium]